MLPSTSTQATTRSERRSIEDDPYMLCNKENYVSRNVLTTSASTYQSSIRVPTLSSPSRPKDKVHLSMQKRIDQLLSERKTYASLAAGRKTPTPSEKKHPSTVKRQVLVVSRTPCSDLKKQLTYSSL